MTHYCTHSPHTPPFIQSRAVCVLYSSIQLSSFTALRMQICIYRLMRQRTRVSSHIIKSEDASLVSEAVKKDVNQNTYSMHMQTRYNMLRDLSFRFHWHLMSEAVPFTLSRALAITSTVFVKVFALDRCFNTINTDYRACSGVKTSKS